MRYEHPNFGQMKVFEVTSDWGGRMVVREFNNGSPKSSLTMTKSETAQFEAKLAENGWNAVKSRTPRDDSRSREKV